MIKLPLSLQAWGTKDFEPVLKIEVGKLDANLLPLQQGLKYSSMANAENLSVVVLNTAEDEDELKVSAGLFYTGIIAGCNCADDPSPVDEINEYCEVLFCIDKTTAITTVSLIDSTNR